MGVVVKSVCTALNFTFFTVWFWTVIAGLVALRVYLRKTVGRLTCPERLDGKTALVTGANDGIGYETAKELAARGARVLLVCRNVGSAYVAKAYIEKETKSEEKIEVFECDMSSFWSVRQCVKEIHERETQLDLVILNSGIGLIQSKTTKDGNPLVWQVNHYGPFLFLNLIMDLIMKAERSRIIFVTSSLHLYGRIDLDDLGTKTNCPWKVLCDTRMANMLTATWLARKLKNTNVTVNCVNPGLVQLKILRRWNNQHLRYIVYLFVMFFGKTIEEGAATTLTAALDSSLERVTGQYFADCKISKCYYSSAVDPKKAEELWRKSESVVGLYDDEKCPQS